jgi:hypothetical protein
MTPSIKDITQIVSVGSVDGVLTSSALLRLIGRDDVGLCFTQAFAVDKVDCSKFPAGAKVALVDLAVNNRDQAMTTAGFIARIKEAGHQVVAVIDEHSREDWETILGDFGELMIQPQSQSEGKYKSSGAVLQSSMVGYVMLDGHGQELCQAADAGDRMDFSSHFGGMVNQAVKSDIGNDARRVYLARHFAGSTEADSVILGWMAEYDLILADHDIIVAAAQDLGNGIIRVNTVGRKVDVTTLMNRLYKAGARVVISEGDMFVPALKKKILMVAFGTSEKLDILAAIKATGVQASGFAQKANVDLQDEAAALVAIRALLNS